MNKFCVGLVKIFNLTRVVDVVGASAFRVLRFFFGNADICQLILNWPTVKVEFCRTFFTKVTDSYKIAFKIQFG